MLRKSSKILTPTRGGRPTSSATFDADTHHALTSVETERETRKDRSRGKEGEGKTEKGRRRRYGGRMSRDTSAVRCRRLQVVDMCGERAETKRICRGRRPSV